MGTADVGVADAEGVAVAELVASEAIVPVSVKSTVEPGGIAIGGSKKKSFFDVGLVTLTLCPDAESVSSEKTAGSLDSILATVTISVEPVPFTTWNPPALTTSPLSP